MLISPSAHWNAPEGAEVSCNDFKDNDQDGLTDEDNTAPVADAETFEITENGTLVLPVASLLDGDTDADGDTDVDGDADSDADSDADDRAAN